MKTKCTMAILLAMVLASTAASQITTRSLDTLTELTNPQHGDLLYMMADPTDTKLHRKVQLGSIVPERNVRQWGAAGDGVTDDRAAFQAVIDASAEGDAIYVPSGIYLLSLPLLIDSKDKIVIHGSGPGSILKTTGNHYLITIADSDDCVVSDLALLGTGGTANTSQIGVYVENASRTSLLRLRIEDMDYDGITLACSASATTDDTLVADCVVINPGDDGINPGSSSPGGTGVACSRTIIRNCRIYGGASTDDLVHVSFGTADTTITGCTLVGPAESGVAILSPQGRATISDNTIQGVQKGIRRRGYVTPDNEGVMTEVIVADNRFRACSANHIYLEGATQGARCRVAGNFFEEGGTGASDAVIRVEGNNDTICGNHFNFTASTTYGVLASGSGVGLAVTGNQFTGSGYRPLHLFNCSGAVISGNVNSVTGTSMALAGTSTGNLVTGNNWGGTISDSNPASNVKVNNLGQVNWPDSYAYNAPQDKRHIIANLGGWASGYQIRIQLQAQTSTVVRPHILEILVAAQSGTAYTGRCAFIDRLELLTIGTDQIRDHVSDTRAISQLVDGEVAVTHTGANGIIEVTVKHPAAHANTMYYYAIVIRDTGGVTATGQLEVLSSTLEAIP